VAKLECPVEPEYTLKGEMKSTNGTKESRDIIRSMKAIREFTSVKESSVCNLCSKRDVCKVRDMGISELSVSKNYEQERGEVRVDDVQNALYGVFTISKKLEALQIDEGMSIEVSSSFPIKQTA
jgi:hypothetical protein